jgi:protein-S-isoprenylcysteine O-methyltransferase Ste14
MKGDMTMSQRMTIFGIGHKLALISFPYLLLTIGLHYWFAPFFTIRGIPAQLMTITGGILITIGLLINFSAAFAMMRAFADHRLLTGGWYACFKNPMYASFIFFTIPGLSLLLNSWLVWTGSIFLFLSLRRFIRVEESYLKTEFGEAYREYQQKVWCKFI